MKTASYLIVFVAGWAHTQIIDNQIIINDLKVPAITVVAFVICFFIVFFHEGDKENVKL